MVKFKKNLIKDAPPIDVDSMTTVKFCNTNQMFFHGCLDTLKVQYQHPTIGVLIDVSFRK